MDHFPVLYILMRTDLDSMNPGKGMAQASHAANAFMRRAKLMKADLVAGNGDEAHRPIISLADLWEQETPQGFGTAIVLGVNEQEMIETVLLANEIPGLLTETIHDPSYPIVDGEIVHQIPMDTCAYVFGDKNNVFLNIITRKFGLHP